MKKILFILLVCIVHQISAQINETTKPLLNQLSLWNPVTIEQLSIDLQSRTKNLSSPEILSDPSAAGNNTAIVEQIGHENFVQLTQAGTGNANSIRQNGNGNVYYGNIEGENNISTTDQRGNENYIEQLITIDNSQFKFLQRGNQNEIIQEETTGSGKEYEITQRGNGMRIYILNGGTR